MAGRRWTCPIKGYKPQEGKDDDKDGEPQIENDAEKDDDKDGEPQIENDAEKPMEPPLGFTQGFTGDPWHLRRYLEAKTGY